MNQTELLDQFILEARDCLEQVGQRLLEVEKNPGDGELLNDLFRQVHTLKGNCGLFEFKPLERVVHAGEDVLDRVRNGTLSYSNDIADALLEAMDFTAQMIDEIEQSGAIDPAADGRSQTLATALRGHLTAKPAAATVAAAASASPAQAPQAPATMEAQAAAAPPLAPAPAWLSRLPVHLLNAHPDGVAWCYRPEPECFFKGEDPWLLARQAPALKHLDVGTQAPWPAIAEADCYQCNLDMVGLSDAPLAYLSEHFRCVPEQVELIELKALSTSTSTGTGAATPAVARDAAQAAPSSATTASGAAQAASSTAPASAATPANATARSAETLRKRALQVWDDQIALLGRKGIAPGTVAAVREALQGLLRSIDDKDANAHLTDLQQTPASISASALSQWATSHRPEAGVEQEAVAEADHADDHLMTGVIDGGTPSNGGNGGGEGGRRPASDDGSHQKVLKVGQEKIDRLMDLIGEMVVAKNALPYLAQRAETHFQQRELAREIKAQYAVINRIAEDMQHAIMQVRMMPVGTVFQRFGRLVRDTSRKLGKDVALVIEGEETEADKNIIESLADPLIHIIRNSLDHGIELPEVRQKAGKPAQGTIRVAARQESDRVILEIVDDGAGVDPQRVRRKAIERGLIPEDKAQTLTDTEAVQLVFLPGFSTADTISDLSGRGVGMDVVRTAVERINGHVELSSQFGKGTRLRLSLPLSMAVTNVMIIEAGGRRFGVPMDLIVETVRVHADDIHHFKQARTTVLRGRIVPLRALHDLLALDDGPSLNEDGEHAVLVVRFGGENVGLLVDHFHGATDIILKPLEGVLAGLTGFAGTALMGDGSVLMILNPKELV